MGFISVAAGDGLKSLFLDLGCANVVSGGQTMNPLPRICWRRCWPLPPKRCLCCPTTRISSWPPSSASGCVRTKSGGPAHQDRAPGIAAMLAVDPDMDEDAMTDAMTEPSAGCVPLRSPTPPGTPTSTASPSRRAIIWPWRKASSSTRTVPLTRCSTSWRRTPPGGRPPSSPCTSERMCRRRTLRRPGPV